MSANSIMKGRRGFEEVTSALHNLAVSGSQSETSVQFRSLAGKGDAGAVHQQDKSQRSADPPAQDSYHHEEYISTESFTGLPLHVKSPLPADGRELAYERDGNQTKQDYDSEETKCSSLPATVTAFEANTNEQSSTVQEQSSSETPASLPRMSSSESESKVPADEDNVSKGEETTSGGSYPSLSNVPVFESILPSSQSTTSSENSCSASTSDQLDSADVEALKLLEGAENAHGSTIDLSAAKVEQTVTQVKDSLQGFVSGTQEDLQVYLTKIVSNQRDFGFYVSDKLKPSSVDNVMCYRSGYEFDIKENIHKLDGGCGVFLCKDKTTKHHFVLKKIMKTNHRLVGIEFLVQQSQDFLPEIYGVYKEKDIICIFQEYVKGGTLLHTNWNLAQVRQLAEVLLSAVNYLHTQDLVHSDIKLGNLMVRNPSDPESLVLIDFESAKHPSYLYHAGGHTLTYLPPWHEQIIKLQSYDELLKTVDLWAVACVIIFFLIPAERSDMAKHGRDVWSQVMRDIKQDCALCHHNTQAKTYCQACRKAFMQYVKDHGHNILHHHLGQLMNAEIADPNWKALRQVLEYLTDTNNIKSKHISIALSIIKGPVYCQAAIDYDQDINL